MSQSLERLTGAPLNGNNYLTWVRAATFRLSGRGKLDYVTGGKEKPKLAITGKPSDKEKKAIAEWTTCPKSGGSDKVGTRDVSMAGRGVTTRNHMLLHRWLMG